MTASNYSRDESERLFGTAYVPDIRLILEHRLGHNNFSVVPTGFGVRVVIFEEAKAESI